VAARGKCTVWSPELRNHPSVLCYLPPSTLSSAAGDSQSRALPRLLRTTRGVRLRLKLRFRAETYTILAMRCLIVRIKAAMHATFTLSRRPHKLELQTMTFKLQRKLPRMHRPPQAETGRIKGAMVLSHFVSGFSQRAGQLCRVRACLYPSNLQKCGD
jgi:hypothetical protein